MKNPKVFASYSHDSLEHKKWVRYLCTKLCENGVDAILDQWDLSPGGDLTLFVESGVRDADRVIVICTPYYVEKANARKRGVGYEGTMITAELYQNSETTKFIPIIRQSSGNKKTPDFLRTRVYIDFTDDNQFDEKFDELLREIHQAQRIQKPPIGKNPYAGQPSAPEVSSNHLLNIPEKVESASHAYRSAIKLARAGDTIGLQQLLKSIRSDAFQSLVQWRQKELDSQPPGNVANRFQAVNKAVDIANRFQAVNKAVDIVAPLISVALAGVESGNERFNDQKSLLSALLTIRGWQGNNTQPWSQTWVQIPYALGYVYHSLHGALCLNTKQLTRALGLAREKVPFAIESSGTTRVWENPHLMGDCELLLDRKECWKDLANAYNKWEWLRLIFEDDFTYRASLVAYYMALSIHELAAEIAFPNSTPLRVPWDFLSETYEIKQRADEIKQRADEIKQRAADLLHNDPGLSELWECLDVTREQMKARWENWKSRCENWLLHSNQEGGEMLVTTPPEYLGFFNS